MKSKLIFVLLLICFFTSTEAQTFEAKEYFKEGKTLKYRILYPENFDSSNSYPVILFLHGAGERGDDNEKQLVHGSKLFLDSKFRTQYPSVVIFPQCPKDDYWSNAKVDRKTMPIGLKYQKAGKATQPMQLALSLIDSIVALDYSKDDQIYLGGLSMGGMGTFEMLSRRPNMFAAAFPICGGGYPGNVENYTNTALWVFHGAKDNVVKPHYSTEMVLAMQKAGGEVRYSLYPNANHNSWDSAFAEEELFSWLFSHKKESKP